MIPLAKPIITEEMKRAVRRVLDSGRFVEGTETEKFEEKFAKYCGVDFGIGVSSGTSALYLSLLACGVKSGDEVIVPANTFVSVAFAISRLKARPIFVDVDETYNIDPELIAEKISERTRAIIPTHLYGQACDMKEIGEIASRYDLKIVEDACQAHGAAYGGGKVGSLGDVGCFSFYPSKNMTVAGDGGMVVTNREEIAERIRSLRNYGQTEKNVHTCMGYNSRLSEISAAIGIEQLKHLDEWNEKRKKNAKEYTSRLKGLVETPVEKNDHVYHLYVIRTRDRDGLRAYLSQKEIETGIHYPLPVYKQPFYNQDISCPVAEGYSRQILSLPMYPQLGRDEIGKVTESIEKYVQR